MNFLIALGVISKAASVYGTLGGLEGVQTGRDRHHRKVQDQTYAMMSFFATFDES